MGYRKLGVTLLSMLLSTLAVAQGWIEGLQWSSVMAITAGAYIAGNVAAKAQSKGQI